MKSFHRRTARPAPQPATREATAVDRHGLVRADTLLVERGLAQSRAAAQRLILAGCVLADGVPLVKAAQTLRADAVVELTPDNPPRNQAP